MIKIKTLSFEGETIYCGVDVHKKNWKVNIRNLDIRRFKCFDHLCSYVGFVPSTADSGDTQSTRGITNRCNNRLRTALIESSWMLISKDPAILMKYSAYCKRMDKNKAIIRIGKHLLSRIKYVLIKREKYEACVV